jgi:hypothetical protein
MMLTWFTGWMHEETTLEPANLRTPKTSTEWRDYFFTNAEKLAAIPWDAMTITPEELAEIAESLRAWQLGESSDGAHLRAAAKRHAEQTNDPDFALAIDQFIAEEQRHGRTLGAYLERAGVALKTSDWGDTLFRAFRYLLPNMETWTTPVVMVETHALVYYNAIRRATKCPVLQQICKQILADEIPHLQFQCERLAQMYRDRPRWLFVFTMLLHRVFFAGITLAIWAGHRRALRAGGYQFGSHWKCAWTKMGHMWRKMDPSQYRRQFTS